MPQTINLRAYLAKLDEQLRANATDEVIHHCHHILQAFPKNIATYRRLGRALLYNAHWQEADAVLRRVLAVIPEDYVAHIGLSEISQEQNRGNDAIWHLERALEQEPNNSELLASLRELYKRYRSSDNTRIQLTAGAVAQQYARAGRYEQAAETLRAALESQPGRVDLRSLLAQMLWEAGHRVEAAEVALDVLDTLPDCLQANLILARLWLEEERPTDAQRYVNRLEALDPYLALKLVTGADAPDDAFVLNELDYRRHAEQVLTSTQPDWLLELEPNDATPTADPAAAAADEDIWADYEFPTFDTVGEEAPSTPLLNRLAEAPDLPVDDTLADELAAHFRPTVELESAREERSEADLRFDDTLDDVEPPEASSSVAARDLKQETSSLASIFSGRDTPEAENLPDWLAAPDTGSADDEDPLAWLREAGAEIDDDIERPGFELLADQLPDAPAEAADEDEEEDEDPFAWMRERGLEVDDVPAAGAEPPDEPQTDLIGRRSAPEPEDEEDPLAWIRERGIEVDDVISEPALVDPFETENDMPIQDPASDPLGWMSQYEDIVWSEDEPGDEPAEPAPAAHAPPGADFPDWPDSDDAPAIALPESTAGENDQPDEYSWLHDASLLAGRDDTAQGQASPHEAPAFTDSIDTDFDWLNALNSATDEAETDRAQTSTAAPAETNILDDDRATDFFADAGGPANAPAHQEAETADRQEDMSDNDKNRTPDWLSGQSDHSDAGGAQPDWLEDFDDEAAPAPEPVDMPEWLADMKPEGEAAPSAETAPSPNDSEDAAFDEFQWASAIEESDESSDTPQLVTSEETAFEWDAQPPAGDVAREDETPAWVSDFELPEADAEPEPLVPDVPDWLNELQPPAPGSETTPRAPVSSATETDSDDSGLDLGWIDELIEEEESGAGVTGAPQPAISSAADEDEDVAAWMGDLTAEAGLPTAPEATDWLTSLPELEADAPATETAPAGASEFEWFSDIEAEIDEAEAAAGVPDWLKELEPDTDVVAAAGRADSAADEVAETFEWVDTAATDESEPAAVVETPDWLSELEPEQPPPGAVIEDEATVVTVQPGEQPDWLVDSLPSSAVTEEATAVQPVDTAEEFEVAAEDAFAFDELAFETEHRPAQNAPDWLNAMVPGVDLDYDPAADELVEAEAPVETAEPVRSARDFDWLNEIIEEETQPALSEVAEAPASPFIFSKPPAWLRGSRSERTRDAGSSSQA